MNELKCPKCNSEMKEYVTSFKCRVLECSFKYKKSFSIIEPTAKKEEEYKEYGFCNAVECPQMLDDKDCIIGDDYHLCLKAIPEFETWLKENNYKIIQRG